MMGNLEVSPFSAPELIEKASSDDGLTMLKSAKGF